MKLWTGLFLLSFFLFSSTIQAQTKMKLPSNNQIPLDIKQKPIKANEGFFEHCIDFTNLIDSETLKKGEIGGISLYKPTFSSHTAKTPDGHVTFENLYGLKKRGSNLGLIKGVPNPSVVALIAYSFDKGATAQFQVIRIKFNPPVQRVKVLAGRGNGPETSLDGLESSKESSIKVEGGIQFKSTNGELVGDAEKLYDIKVHGLKKINWIERKASSENAISTIFVNGGGGGSGNAGDTFIWGLCY